MTNAERLRRTYRVLGLVPIFMLVGGAFGVVREEGDFTGPAWAIALWVGGAALLGIFQGLQALTERSVTWAVACTANLLAAFLISTPHDNVERPAWLAALSVGLLVVTCAGAVPLLVHLVRAQRDERERRLLGSASAIAFGVVMLIVASFSVLSYDHLSTLGAPRLTPTWIVLTGAISWLASFAVLRRRM
jgi:hypothetical protein